MNPETRTAGDLALETAVVAFAAWTIVCQATAFLEGDARVVVAGGGFAALAVAGVWIGLRPSVRSETNRGERIPGLPFAGTNVTLLAVVFILGTISAVLLRLDPRWATVPALAGLALGSAFGFRGESPDHPVTDGRRVTILCLVVAVAATAVLDRPDADDAFYLGIANAVADRPGEPILKFDPLHGVPGLELRRGYHRFRTIEVLLGGIGLVTGIAPIQWAHRVLPLFAAAALVLAQRRLLRILVPDRWPAALTAAIVVLLTIGDAHGWYGNLGLVRLHQGKGVLVSVLVPLAIAVAVEFSRGPTVRRWILLAALQVAAIGLNPTAIWLMPLLVWGALAAARPFGRGALRTAAAGALSAVYALIGGGLLLTDLVPRLQRSLVDVDGHELLSGATDLVLGHHALPALAVFTIVVAWVLVPPGPGRRVLIALPLVLAAIFNPWAARPFASIATGARTFWRVLWLIPLPAIIAVVVTAPLALRRARPAFRAAASLAAVFMCSLVLPSTQLISAANGVRIAPFALKVPAVEGAVARAIVAAAPAGSTVLAPWAIDPWVTVWPGHPCPLVVRPDYLTVFSDLEERERRSFLTDWVSERSRALSQKNRFLEGLDRCRPAVVCIRPGHPEYRWWTREARARGYEPVRVVDRFELWRRPPAGESGL